MYVCMCVCMYVCMYDVCMYVCMYVCICMYVCMYVCMYMYVAYLSTNSCLTTSATLSLSRVRRVAISLTLLISSSFVLVEIVI